MDICLCIRYVLSNLSNRMVSVIVVLRGFTQQVIYLLCIACKSVILCVIVVLRGFTQKVIYLLCIACKSVILPINNTCT